MSDKINGLDLKLPKENQKSLKEMTRNIHEEKYETLKVVLEETRKNPTPQMVEATAKLVEVVHLGGPSY